MAIRGSYYAFESYGTRLHKGYAFMYGLAGILIPASLSVVLAIAQGGFVEIVDGSPVLDYFALFTSPLSWSIVVLALVAVLYISSVFLTWYADKAQDADARDLMRKYALFWAVPLIVAASGIIIEIYSHNRALFDGIMNLWVYVCNSLYTLGIDCMVHLEKKELYDSCVATHRSVCFCVLWVWNSALSILALSTFIYL